MNPAGSAAGATSAVTSPAAATAAPPAAPSDAASSPIHQIVIQLNPENLGSVSIRMRMAGDRVDIQIHVANNQTLDLLNKDRHVLTAAIEAAGGSADALSVASAASSASGGGADLGQGNSSGGAPGSAQQQAFASSGSAGGGGAQRGGQPDESTAPILSRDETDVAIQTGRSNGADNSVYL